MANASLDPIKTRLNETDPYHPGSANTFYDWSMEAGDVVTMKRGEEEYDIPVFSSRTLWKGTPQIVVNSTGNKEHEAIANASKNKFRRGSAAMRGENYLYHEFTSSDGMLYSAIYMSESKLQTVFSDAIESVNSTIIQTASEIYSAVYSGDSSVYSYVLQTATQIYSHVGDVESGLHSEINQTADQIYSAVYSADSAVYAYVNQTASGIRQEVGNTAAGLQSNINQQANRISLVVEGTGSNASIKAAQIVAAINDDGTSQTLISANKILLDGNTTIYGVLGIEDGGLKVKGNAFFNGDITMASGKEILAGAIRSTGVRFPGSNPGADRTLTLDDVTGMIVKAEVSSDGKTLKLWKKGDASSSPSITFEKAAPVNSLTGNWSGSTLTINTDPSIQGVDYTIGFGGQYGADDTELQIASNSLPTVVSSVALSVPVTVQSLNSTGSPTERYTTAVTANIANLLQARTGNNKITMNGPYTPDPGYIGFSSVEVDVSGSSTIDGLTGNWSNNVLSVKTDPDAGYTYTVGFGGQYGDHNTEFSVVGNGLPTFASATSLNFPVKVQSLNPSGSPTDRYTTSITAAVSTLLQTKSATSNNTYTPDQGYIGLSSVQVAVPLKVSGGWSGNTNTFTAQYSASGENSVSITPRVHPITGTAENATIKIGELNNGSWTDHGGDTNLYLVLSGKTVYLNSRNSASGSGLLTYAQKDVSSVYDAGHDDGLPDSGTATARVGETEDWTFTIESADETSTNLTIDVGDIYDDARQGYVPTSTGKAAATYNTSTSDQVISAGQYLKGDQTIRAVTTSGISEANIKSGTVVKVGDAGSDTRIITKTGTFTAASTVSSGQTAATADKILPGYSAWVDGEEVMGTSEAIYTQEEYDDYGAVRYAAGQGAVTLTDPVWTHTADYTDGISNTVTVSTSGRPTQLDKAIPVTIVENAWAANKRTKTVDIQTTNGAIVARKTINADTNNQYWYERGGNEVAPFLGSKTNATWDDGRVTRITKNATYYLRARYKNYNSGSPTWGPYASGTIYTTDTTRISVVVDVPTGGGTTYANKLTFRCDKATPGSTYTIKLTGTPDPKTGSGFEEGATYTMHWNWP